MIPIMECGCAANAVREGKDGLRQYSCIHHSTVKQLEVQPDLTLRMARCRYGCESSIAKSRTDMQFFEYRPAENYDLYYCGCWAYD
jgi:hypothetical protein